MNTSSSIIFREEIERVIDSTTIITAGSVCSLCNGKKNINNGVDICWKCSGTGISRIPDNNEYNEDNVFSTEKGIMGIPGETN